MDLNLPRPVVAGGTGASTAGGALVNFGLTATAAELNVLDGVTITTAQINAAGQLAGRNRIINGQGRINQRVYVSGTATTGANQYTLDQWRVVTSGQSLTFTGDASKRTMTAPAGGVEQVIEGANIEGGTYVLNWTGTAAATVDGVSIAKGQTFTLTANTNATVRFTSGTFTDVQLELGTTPTVFERLPLSEELVRCYRYFYRVAPGAAARFGVGHASTTTTAIISVPFPVTMRAAPTGLLQSGTVGDYDVQYANAASVCTSVPTLTSASQIMGTVVFTCAAVLTTGDSLNGRATGANGFLAWSAEL